MLKTFPPDSLGLRCQQVGCRQSNFRGEAICPAADDQDVRQELHDHSRGLDGVLMCLERADRAGTEPAAIHDAGVELDLPE